MRQGPEDAANKRKQWDFRKQMKGTPEEGSGFRVRENQRPRDYTRAEFPQSQTSMIRNRRIAPHDSGRREPRYSQAPMRDPFPPYAYQRETQTFHRNSEGKVFAPARTPRRRRKLNKRNAAVLLLAILCLLLILGITVRALFKHVSSNGSPQLPIPVGQSVHMTKQPQEVQDQTLQDNAELEQFLKEHPQIHYNENLILVNAEHAVPNTYKLDLVSIPQSQQKMARAAQTPYKKMLQALEEASDPISVLSAYRSKEDQKETFQKLPEFAQKPGFSEHETGLALDFATPDVQGEDFAETEQSRWLEKNAPRYGFILRYQRDYEQETGIRAEPWHYRYVGLPHSKIMQEHKLSLEKYLESLKYDKIYSFEKYRIVREKGPQFRLPKGWERGTVSPDNMGGYIFTLEEEPKE